MRYRWNLLFFLSIFCIHYANVAWATGEQKSQIWHAYLSKLYNRNRRKVNRKNTKETIGLFDSICKERKIQSIKDINCLNASCFKKKALSNDKYELDVLKLFFLLQRKQSIKTTLSDVVQEEIKEDDYKINKNILKTKPLLDTFLSDSLFKVCFSPRGKCQNMLIECIKKAKSSLHIATFVLTSLDIKNVIAIQYENGIKVQIVTDQGRSNTKNSMCSILHKKGISIRTGKHSYMHHKFVIIDLQRVITGSFNYSARSQNTNSENLLLVESKDLALQYFIEFEKLWKEGSAFNSLNNKHN